MTPQRREPGDQTALGATTPTWTVRLARWAIVGVLCASAGCGVVVPDNCDENVRRVTRMRFDGPAVIEAIPDGIGFVSNDVTIAVEKIDADEIANVCYVVRDDDPWYKLFWSVDDVLDASALAIASTQDTRTFEDAFLLEEEHEDEVCGNGALPGDLKVRGCSGEREAEVYLQPILAEGVESPRRQIRVE